MIPGSRTGRAGLPFVASGCVRCGQPAGDDNHRGLRRLGGISSDQIRSQIRTQNAASPASEGYSPAKRRGTWGSFTHSLGWGLDPHHAVSVKQDHRQDTEASTEHQSVPEGAEFALSDLIHRDSLHGATVAPLDPVAKTNGGSVCQP